MAARTRKGTDNIPLDDEWRKKIRVSNIMTRLEKGFMGEVKLTAEQINAAKLVLSKLVPDLARTESKIEHSGNFEVSSKMRYAIENLPPNVLEKVRTVLIEAKTEARDEHSGDEHDGDEQD